MPAKGSKTGKPKRKVSDDWPILDKRTPMEEPYRPIPIPDLMLAFPANVTGLMPADDVLDDVRHNRDFDSMGWDQLFTSMFYSGIKTTAKFLPREVDGQRLDGETCWRHLRALSGSFQPKHEYKEAAFIVLCKEFFEWGIWEDSSGKVFTAGDELTEEDKRELGF